MNLTHFAIAKNRITFCLLAIVVIMGIAMYKGLPRDSMPPYTVRVATVVSNFPGASPERVELLVSKNIEEKVQEIPEVKDIASQSRTGLSVVTVTLRDEVAPEQLQSVWDELRRKLDAMDNLPESVQPQLNDDDVGVVYGVMLGLISHEFSYADMEDVARRIRDDLIKLPDSAKVVLGGIQEQQVFVEFDNARLGEYGLSVSKLQQIIQSTNILDSGGEINLGNKRLILEPTGNFNTLDDIRKLVVPVGTTGDTLYLEEITQIRKAYKSPPVELVRVNGLRAIAISVSLKSGANVIKLGRMVDERIATYNRKLPLGLEVRRLASMDGYVQQSIADFQSNLIQSIVIVLLVMLVFLGLRTGFVVASLIPLVTIMTLMLMGLISMGLNQVTLAALIMALGMMVDNGIVVSESILVKLEAGKKRLAAAVETCSELAVPLLISTLTTSAAFLSFFLAESTMGDIVGPIFVVISLALLSSWVLALTIIPLLGHSFMKVKKKAASRKSVFDLLCAGYMRVLPLVLRIRLVFVVAMLGLFVVSLKGFGLIPFIFFPDSERNLVTVDINLPLGTKIEATTQVIDRIEAHIEENLKVTPDRRRGIVDWSAYIGKGPEAYDLGYSADEPNPSYAHILLNTSSGADNALVIDRLDRFCFDTFPDADIRVALLGQGGGGTPVEIRILGSSPDKLYEIAETVKTQLNQVPGTKNVSDDWGPKLMKFIIDIDRAKAQKAGVSHSDIAVSLKTVLSGFQAGVYREGEDSLAVMMRSGDFDRQTVQTIENTNIFAQASGIVVPLSQVAQVVPKWDFAKIMRFDLSRSITVKSYVKTGFTASVINGQMSDWLTSAAASWPSGYRYEFGGDEENTQDNMGAVIKYLPLSAVIILMLLMVQFNSFRKTVMVLATIPLGVIGVVIGLIVFGSYFGFMAFLGTISLAGIVINNAIVLLDRIELERNQNQREPQAAVIEACRQRFRPILLTTFTTTLGLIPLYLGGGIMWEPMAVAIMVGLLFATVITLLFIPALYGLLFRVSFKGYR